MKRRDMLKSLGVLAGIVAVPIGSTEKKARDLLSTAAELYDPQQWVAVVEPYSNTVHFSNSGIGVSFIVTKELLIASDHPLVAALRKTKIHKGGDLGKEWADYRRKQDAECLELRLRLDNSVSKGQI